MMFTFKAVEAAAVLVLVGTSICSEAEFISICMSLLQDSNLSIFVDTSVSFTSSQKILSLY